jgi:hypothetical protein
MIKSFDTNFSSTPSGAGSSTSGSGTGSMKKVIMVVALIGVVYLGYKFVVKPMLDKNKEEK